MLRYPNSEGYSGLEVEYRDSGLEVEHQGSGLEVSHPASLPPPPPLSPPLNSQVPADNSREKYGWWTKRRLWLAFLIIGIVMIAIVAIIVGGVVGGLSRKRRGHSGRYRISFQPDIEEGDLVIR